MTLKIAICDDCEKDRKHMIQLLLSYAFAHEYDFHIEEFLLKIVLLLNQQVHHLLYCSNDFRMMPCIS